MKRIISFFSLLLLLTEGIAYAKPDYSELDRAIDNFFVSLDGIVKILPSVTDATGTIHILNEWALANETISAAAEHFTAKYPEVLSHSEQPPEYVATLKKLTRLKTDYAAVPAGVGTLLKQFGEDPAVKRALERFQQSLTRLENVGRPRFAESEKIVVQKPASSTEYAEATRGHFGIWTDPKCWTLNPHPKDLFSLEFSYGNGKVIGSMSAESGTVPFDRLPAYALANGRTVFPKLNLISQGLRVVSGKDVLFLTMEGSYNNTLFTIYGYYYTGPEGTVQLVTTFETKYEKESKSVALAFLNGLQIGERNNAMTQDKTNNKGTTLPASEILKVDLQALNTFLPYRVNDPAAAKITSILKDDPAMAAKRLQLEADKGTKLAIYFLALYYSEGKGVEKDTAHAVELMKQAVAANLPLAEVTLASWYINCFFVSKDPEEAERLCRKAAATGLPMAESELGEIIFLRDPKASIEWLRKAADKGFARAEFRLFLCYHNGTGVEKNAEEEIKWLQRASLHGDKDAKETLGEFYWSGQGVPKNTGEAVKLFREAAKAGVPAAQNNLGYCLVKGEGVPVDKEEGVDWIRKAAEQGLPNAQKGLGYSYVHGIGVSRNVEQGIAWYEKAAKQGIGEAQLWTGIAYLHGEGVEKNIPVALDWLRKAADQNVPLAWYNLGAIYIRGDGVPLNKQEGLMWTRKAAEAGNGTAQYFLAGCYSRGDGIEKDENLSYEWCRKAAENGIAGAQLNLGGLYLQGIGGVPKNVDEAVKWIRRAADQGDSNAEYQLGLMYVNGTGVETSPEEAVRWFRLSAIHGNPRGQNAFGYGLATGQGVKQNLIEAYKWYLLAMAQNEPDPKSRAEVNKNAISPRMTPEQIKEAEKRASEFKPVEEKKEESDPFSINAA